MMRLIDADDFIKTHFLYSGEDACEAKEGDSEETLKTKAICRLAIKALESAPEIKNTKEGFWYLYSDHSYFMCSECGNGYDNLSESTEDAKDLLKRGIYYKYCPFCGAKMEAERYIE